jgi:hypothetical protein
MRRKLTLSRRLTVLIYSILAAIPIASCSTQSPRGVEWKLCAKPALINDDLRHEDEEAE